MTFRVTVDTAGLEAAAQRLGRAPERVREQLDRGLRAAGAVAMRRWKQVAPADKGTLRTSVNRVQRLGDLHYLVAPEGLAAGYAPYVERGRKAGEKMPPVSALERWGPIRTKLAAKVRAAYVGGLVHGRTRRSFESFVRSAAFLVARAIKRRGIRPVLMSLRSAEAARVHLLASTRRIESATVREIEGR